MANANDDIKNKLGNEYDLYSSLKDKFQGFDKDGHAIFKDEAGDVTSFNKSDFAKMNQQLKQDFGEKSYEDSFNQNQYEDLAKQGNKFQGFAGDNAIFRNEKGDLENFGNQGGFASFLKKQQPNASFDISKQGQSQRSKNDYIAGADFLANKEVVKQKTGSGFTGYNPQAALQSLGGKMMTPQPELKSSVNPNIAKANTPGGTFSSFKSKQPTAPKKPAPPKQQYESYESESEDYTPAAPPSLGDTVKQMALQKAGDEFAKLKAQGSNLLEAKKDEAQGALNSKIADATGLSTQMLTNPADAAKQAAINKAAGVTGFSADTLLNPEQAAKDAALSKLTSTTGLNASLLKGDIKDNLQNLAEDRVKTAGMEYLKANDPTGMAQYAGLINGDVVNNAKDFAIDKAKSAGLNYLKENDPTGMAQYAGLIDGDFLTNAKNLALDKGKDALKNYLKDNDPTGGQLSGGIGLASNVAKLLNGDVLENARDIAKEEAKKEAMRRVAEVVPGGAYAGTALDAGKAAKNILKGDGTYEDKGRAAAQAAARSAAAYLSGGVATEQNLELSKMASDKAYDAVNKNIGSDLKPVTQSMQGMSELTHNLAKDGAKLGLDVVGNMGAAQGRAFNDAKTGLKSITSGNIEEGLKGLGSGAANLAIQTFLKNPATIAKGIGNLGKQAVAKAAETAAAAAKSVLNAINPFCFAPDTKILMADGKYKKIKDIKLGDEVMLGGKVTAIGQSTSDDMYIYDGVEVSGGHTLYEDGVWVRTKDSKYAVKMDIDEALVYPMDTENHLIVTKGQVWADMSEIDNTYDKKDTDILAELNNQTEANHRIDLFLALYFKQKRN